MQKYVYRHVSLLSLMVAYKLTLLDQPTKIKRRWKELCNGYCNNQNINFRRFKQESHIHVANQ